MQDTVRNAKSRGVVVGGSAGGVAALDDILAALGPTFPLPLLVVQHLHASDRGEFRRHVARNARLPVAEVFDKCSVRAGTIYTAPADYHMLLERDGTISLSIDACVNWSRPSIDVLFESAAIAWGAAAVGVILSGANADGARGIRAIRCAGGLTFAQDPATAEVRTMPQAAIDAGGVGAVLAPAGIAEELVRLGVAQQEGEA